MYTISIDSLIKQIMPPNWRHKKNISTLAESGQYKFLKTVCKPFKSILNDFKLFRKETELKINLSPETIVIENHLMEITGVRTGIFLIEVAADNNFSVNIPLAGQPKENEVKQFLNRIVPIGRKFTLIFY